VFWAMDSEPAGVGYASANVPTRSCPLPHPTDDICEQMPARIRAARHGAGDAECDLTINDVDAARFVIRASMGPFGIEQYQYVYIQDRGLWC